MSKLILIAAMANNNIIGQDGQIPWRIPEDMKRFRELTLGHPVIMGRKTYESIPEKFRPLVGRTNIVVSKSSKSYTNGVIVYHSIEDALKKGIGEGDCYVAGGAQIYEQTIKLADKLEITEVHKEIIGDSFFPQIDKSKWKEILRENYGDYSFVTYGI